MTKLRRTITLTALASADVPANAIEPIYGPGLLAINKPVHQYATVHNNDESGDDRVEVSFDATRIS
jgi:hypothetical protein